MKIVAPLFLFFAAYLSALSQWHLIEPYPTGHFTSVDFANDSIGIITETFGYYRTTNQGQSWKLHWFEDYNYPVQVDFASEEHGFMVFRNRPVLHSSNVGETWEPWFFGEEPLHLNRIAFDTQGNGMAVSGGITLLKTTNYGETWKDISKPIRSSYGEWIKFTDVQVLNDSIAFLRGGGGADVWKTLSDGLMLMTTDGGGTWETILTYSHEFISQYFWSRDSGVVASRYRIFTTHDGGKNWTMQADVPRGILPETRSFLMTSFGHLLGLGSSPGFSATASHNEYVITVSEDQGNTWAFDKSYIGSYDHSIKGKEDVINDASWAGDSPVGFGVGPEGGIFRTLDGGRSWMCWSQPNLHDVDMVDDSVGYIVGEAILKTTDGGKHWSELAHDTSYALKNVAFVSRDTGFFVERFSRGGNYKSRLYRTTDGGKTHQQIASDIFNIKDVGRPIWQIDFPVPGLGIIRTDSLLYKTTDMGESWIAHPLPFLPYYRGDFGFTPSGTGYAFGYNKQKRLQFFRTSDFGTSWELVKDSPNFAGAVSFFDADHGVMTSGFFTTDGGNSWSQAKDSRGNALSLGLLSDAVMINQSQAFYVGAFNQTVVSTNDAGKSWHSEFVFPYSAFFRNHGQDLYGISFSGKDVGVAVGYHGTIYSYDCSPPEAFFRVNYDTAGKVFFRNFSTRTDSVFWDFGDGETLQSDYRNGGHAFHAYQTEGPHTVRLIVINCGHQDTMSIEVMPRDVRRSSHFVETQEQSVRREGDFVIDRILNNEVDLVLDYSAGSQVIRSDLYDLLGRHILQGHVVRAGSIPYEGRLKFVDIPHGVFYMVVEHVNGARSLLKIIGKR